MTNNQARPYFRDFSRRENVGLLATMSAPGLMTFCIPVFVDILMRPATSAVGGLSASLAGGIGTSELLAAALTAFALSGTISRPRLTAIVGAAIALSGNLFCLTAERVAVLGSMRVIVGVGLGLVGASGTVLLGSLADPDRAAGYALSVGIGIGALCIFLFPPLVDGFGAGAIYWLFAAICIGTLIAARGLPSRIVHSGAQLASAPANRESTNGSGPSPISLLGVAAYLMLIVGDSALYAFAMTFGERAGLSASATARVLGALTIGGVFAAAIAAPIAARLGRTLPLLVLGTIKTVGTALFMFTVPSWLYVTIQAALTIGIFTAQPWYLGTVASADHSGRSSVIAAGCLGLGGAIGPFLGGVVFDNAPPWALPATAAIVTAGSCIAAAIAATVIARREQADRADAPTGAVT